MKGLVGLGLVVVSAVVVLPQNYAYAGLIMDIHGCTTSDALNYNPEATKDDGTCVFLDTGCTDIMADNYDTEANRDDGSCTYSLNARSCIDKAWLEKERCASRANEGLDPDFWMRRCIEGYNNSVFQCGCAHDRFPNPICYDACARELRACQDEAESAYYSCMNQFPHGRHGVCAGVSRINYDRCVDQRNAHPGQETPSCVRIVSKPIIQEPTPSPTPRPSATPSPTPSPTPRPSATPTSTSPSFYHSW